MRHLWCLALLFVFTGCGSGSGGSSTTVVEQGGGRGTTTVTVIPDSSPSVSLTPDAAPTPTPIPTPTPLPAPTAIVLTIDNAANVPASTLTQSEAYVSEAFSNDFSPAYGPTITWGPGGYIVHLVNGGGSYHTLTECWVDVTEDPTEFTLPLAHESEEMIVRQLGYDYEACDGLGFYNIGGAAGYPVAYFWLPNQTAVVVPSPLDETFTPKHSKVRTRLWQNG